MKFFLAFIIALLLPTTLSYQLPNKFKKCLLQNEIDIKPILEVLQQCINNEVSTIVKSIATRNEPIYKQRELQNNFIECFNNFEFQVKVCLQYNSYNDWMNIRMEPRGARTPNTTKNETVAEPNITACILNFESLKPKARNCTEEMKSELIEKCNVPIEDETLNLHWYEKETDENETDYCKRENEQTLCTVITLDSCTDTSARKKYQEYFACIYKTGICRSMIQSAYIHLLPLKDQPKRPWMKQKSSAKLDFSNAEFDFLFLAIFSLFICLIIL